MSISISLQAQNDRYLFIPTASVSIISDFVKSNVGSVKTTANVSCKTYACIKVLNLDQHSYSWPTVDQSSLLAVVK